MSRGEPLVCERCGEGVAEPRDLALHRGRVHGEELDEAEQASFELAVEDETAWLQAFRRHVRSALATLPIFLVYGVVVLSGYVYRASEAFMVLPLPGILGFVGLTYYMVYRHQGVVEEA
jgi:hypothetical protein